MAKGRTDEVSEGEADGEDPLGEGDEAAEEGPRLPQLQKGHEVHPLVLGLFEQSVDPAVVTLVWHVKRLRD